jgi:lipoteichoic acid synthase
MSPSSAISRPKWNRLKPHVRAINCWPVYCLALYVVFNAVKGAVFNHIIVGDASSPCYSECLNGFINKLILTCLCAVILIRPRHRSFIAAFYIAQTVYILTNVIYYLSFQGYLHISQYTGLFSEGFDLLTHAALPWEARSLVAFIDLPFLVGILIAYHRLSEINRRYFFKPVLYGASVLFLIVFYKWEVPLETPLQQLNNAYESDASVVKKYGLLTFNILDLFNYRDTRARIKVLTYGPPVAAPDTADTHPNILIMQIESLDAYIIDYLYKKKFVTPFLHDLSRKCIFFPYLLSYHLAGSTSDCEFATINSVEPFADFPSIKLRNYDYPNSILKRCAADGYSVVAFHGNRGTYFNRNAAFKKMGFQAFYDMFAMRLPEIGWGASDESVFDFVKSQMLHQKQPFLYYCITMSSHEPFVFVKPYYRNSAFDDIKDGPVRNYLNSMSYVDNMLKKFIPAVRNTCPNMIIFIYGDHTPSLPKCGYQKALITLKGQPLEFVPLLIVTPENTVYREKRLAASFLDIAPTVLAAGRCKGTIQSYGLNLLSLPTQDKGIPYRMNIYSRKSLYGNIGRKR